MEQGHFSISTLLGTDRILISVNSKNTLLWQDWDESRHCNADWELHLILNGTCLIDVEDRQYHLQKNQAILIAPGQYHRPKAQASSFSRFTLSFSPHSESLRQALHEKISSACVIDADDALCRLAANIADEWDSEKAYSRICTEALMTQLMIWLLRILNVEENRKAPSKAAKSKALTALIDEYFEQNFAAPAGEEALANWLHLSRRQLVRILQEAYGMSYRQKLIHTRMDYAAWLLRTTDMKINQIGSKVGYTSEAAFFQVFRKYYNTSPRQYRLQKKNENP